jgi:hypothetical protein
MRMLGHMGNAWGIGVCILLGAASASAQGRSVQGTVVRSDSPTEMVIDVGTGQGLSNGDVLELWRPYRVKHPVTGRLLEDRFRIGSLRVTQARPTLSLAQPDGAVAHGVQAGDVVMIQVAGSAPPPPATGTTGQTPTPGEKCPEVPVLDVESRDLSKLFDELTGTSPRERAQRYLAYVSQHPHSRYAPVLRQESSDLTRTFGPSTAQPAPTGPEVVAFEPAAETYAHEPLHITIELDRAKAAVLYARNQERLTFLPIKMDAMQNGYFTASIPADQVHTPNVEYFVEAIAENGQAISVQGSAATPVSTPVIDRPVAVAPQPVRVEAAIWSDFAAFNTRKLNDWVSQTEGVLSVRFQDTGLRSMRTGFGVYRGVGGTLNELDTQNLDPRSIGLTYGYLEGEYAFHTIFSIILRGIVGLREPGVDGGGHLFFRIGNDLKTNLMLGGEVLGGIGVRGIAQLEWNTLPRFPILFRSEVTNQPAGIQQSTTDPNMASAAGDIGVRLIAQAGFRITPAFVVALRGSFQGRTINHAGPGGGAAISYQW